MTEITNSNAIGAEFRGYEEREREGQPVRVAVAARTYPTDPADLWDAMTSADRLPRWFLPIEGDLKQGGRYQLIGNAGGTILRCDPPEALDLSWEFAGATSWVTVRLAGAGEEGGTRLTLEHIFPKSDDPESDEDAFWQKFGPGAVGVGWDLSFMGLGMHIASGGAPVDLEAAHGWTASDEGKAFMRASADAWAAAHIAGGEADEVAHGMAARTASFYCGEGGHDHGGDEAGGGGG